MGKKGSNPPPPSTTGMPSGQRGIVNNEVTNVNYRPPTNLRPPPPPPSPRRRDNG